MTQKEFSIKVLHVAPECAPLIKKGGLGDVAGARQGRLAWRRRPRGRVDGCEL